ncbi:MULTISPECIES: hypothetical protein [Streptomyces]|uniref:hypothetical protein n=1 Tax=Streptomyces TaxID=1883 RepID=UPI0004C639EC|nr:MULTISPECIES: hypothetical protein [Streptomyces]RPK90732.1 hypothetical protein EES46_12330 [Streptomyces sp. ADI98-10]
MDTRAYNALYRPARLTPPPRRTAVELLATGLWVLTMTSLAWLGFLVGMTALWCVAEGAPVGGFLLRCSAGLCGGAAVLVAVRLAPGVRRMSADMRSLLLAALACPLPLVLAIATWFAAQ